MDLTSGLLLLMIGIPVSIVVLGIIGRAMAAEGKKLEVKKRKPSWKSDDCQWVIIPHMIGVRIQMTQL